MQIVVCIDPYALAPFGHAPPGPDPTSGFLEHMLTNPDQSASDHRQGTTIPDSPRPQTIDH